MNGNVNIVIIIHSLFVVGLCSILRPHNWCLHIFVFVCTLCTFHYDANKQNCTRFHQVFRLEWSERKKCGLIGGWKRRQEGSGREATEMQSKWLAEKLSVKKAAQEMEGGEGSRGNEAVFEVFIGLIINFHALSPHHRNNWQDASAHNNGVTKTRLHCKLTEQRTNKQTKNHWAGREEIVPKLLGYSILSILIKREFFQIIIILCGSNPIEALRLSIEFVFFCCTSQSHILPDNN